MRSSGTMIASGSLVVPNKIDFDEFGTVSVSGKRPIDLAKSYESGIRDLYGDVPLSQRTYFAPHNKSGIARYVFDEVRDVFSQKVDIAKQNGAVFDGYQFEQVHHWNWPISTYNSQAIDPANLFPTTKAMHENIHNMTTSGAKKIVPFSYFHPINEIHVR